jgi:hypothetical protein
MPLRQGRRQRFPKDKEEVGEAMRNWKSKLLEIPESEKIGIALVTYNQGDCLASLIHAIKAQTFKNFKIYIMHDGNWTCDEHRDKCIKAVDNDPRFSITCTDKRANKFGHNMRKIGIRSALEDGCNWIGTMNGDCWYVPVYFEWMLSQALTKKANFVYCNMIHSHQLWESLNTSIKRGKIDGGCFLANRDICKDVKWGDTDFAADWHYIERLKKQPNFAPVKIDRFLFTHN